MQKQNNAAARRELRAAKAAEAKAAMLAATEGAAALTHDANALLDGGWLAMFEGAAKALGEPARPLTRGFGMGFDIYEPHRKTRHTEADETGATKLVPHVAVKSRRAITKANAKGELGPSGPNKTYRVIAQMRDGEAKPGTWRHKRLSSVLAFTDKHSAQVAYAKNPWPDERPLDDYCFNWAKRKGYIVFDD